MTVGEAGEHRVIALVQSLVPPPPDYVHVGIGDDAALVTPARNALEVLTTDACVEGVHFDRRFVDPASIGHRALAANLSDLAAMGASPRAALLSLGLPDAFPFDDLECLLRGFLALVAAHRLPLVGGNVTRSPGPLFLDVTLTGSVRPRKALTRAGGRAGDELFVSGTLGAAAAGLRRLRRQADEGRPVGSDTSPGIESAVARYLRPLPRLRLGTIVGRTRAASACVDLSDGLADAVRQMAAASGTGAALEADALPIDAGAREIAGPDQDALVALALEGGDDYELLCAVPPKGRRRFAAAARTAGIAVTHIGVLRAGGGLSVVRDGREAPLPQGFQHFR